jgi:putative glutamine amidotransferase
MSHSRQPIIGITTRCRTEVGDYPVSGKYVDVIRSAGGIPILLTPGEIHLAGLVSLVDGLILSGGGDLCPKTYGGEAHPDIRFVDAERDAFELALARYCLETGLPVLGICRGMQVLSVISGGQLFPHVPDEFSEIDHFSPADRQPIRHAVQVLPQTRLAAIIQVEELSVVSWHHQGIRTAPHGWKAVAHAPDGLIEAIEHEAHPWAVALQWHPEFSSDDPSHRRIFDAFIQAVTVARVQGSSAISAADRQRSYIPQAS